MIFAGVATVMATMGAGVARTFARFEPLEAYRLDIAGSLGGIVLFSLISFLGAPPVVWGIVVAAALVALYGRSIRPLAAAALATVVALLLIESLALSTWWSPYYKISLVRVSPAITSIDVNGIPHQTIESTADRRRTNPIYFLPYGRDRATPRNVLVIGAGNGSDVAIALAEGARHVDAVEIDPRLYQLGRRLNPDRPYQDPRVRVFIDDGRAFLEHTTSRYDLILFALPDSLTLVSGQSSLRLESYLFTREAFTAARDHLTPSGVFAMYNYYRQPWLVDRLANTLRLVFGHAPCVDSLGWRGNLALLTASDDSRGLSCPNRWIGPTVGAAAAPATDDHPFVYLKTRVIPGLLPADAWP